MNIHELFENAPGRRTTSSVSKHIEVVREFAPAGGGAGGNYFQALASAWYNDVFNTGSLQKGIKSQEDVERLLARGVVCPDGVTRKFSIGYNGDFDGVEIYSDDYYEHGDHDATIDSRTGQKWGPYDFMAFSDDDLSESITEFAPAGGDDGDHDPEEILFRLAKQWWLGTEQDMIRVERTLASMGWEIGEDEGSYDDGGVFVVRAGDENGKSYMSWPHEELADEGLSEMDGDGAGRDGSNRKRIGSYGNRDRDIPGPDIHLGPKHAMKPKDITKRAGDVLDKELAKSHKKGVAEGIMNFMQPKQPKTQKDKLTLAAIRQIEKARADKERQDPMYVRSKDLPKNPDHVRVVTDARGDYKPPKEADYGDDYQDMVRRVAAQQKRKQQQPKPAKREDSNMPVAVDSTSPIHGMGEDSKNISTKNVSPASQKLIQKARQAAPDARSDLDAVFAYLDDVAKRTQDNYGRVNDILQQLDPISNDLDRAERELSNVRQVNQGQQQLLGRLKARLDKGATDQAPVQAQQAQQANRDAAERDTINKQLDQEPKAAPVIVQPGTDAETKQKLDQLGGQVQKLNAKDIMRTYKDPKAVAQGAKTDLVRTGGANMLNTAAHRDDQLRQLAANELAEEISEDIYESRLYKMKLAGYFD